MIKFYNSLNHTNTFAGLTVPCMLILAVLTAVSILLSTWFKISLGYTLVMVGVVYVALRQKCRNDKRWIRALFIKISRHGIRSLLSHVEIHHV